ncbi:MAG: hypothetical protein ABEK36_04750, partial [Candidatus Aenigmatarchaeota archaeon]
MEKYPNKKLIIHYEQPYYPFIGEKYRKYFSENKGKIEGGAQSDQSANLLKEFLNSFRGSFDRIVDHSMQRRYFREFIWKLNKFINLQNLPQKTLIGTEEGIDGIRRAYKENVHYALSHVKELIETSTGKFLITADHGDYLGEYDLLFHGE